MNLKRLFSYGSLLFQDKKKLQRKLYADVLPLWSTLHEQYGIYVRDELDTLVSDADGEDLRKISEIVGIACGAKVLCSAFRVNPNRLVRHQATSGKRLDFEFHKGGHHYFHEMKGTTYESKASQKAKDITNQKSGASLVSVRASSATITVYEQDGRRGDGTYVLLIDPPTQGKSRRSRREDELATVLVYYRNILSVTHSGNGNDWLASIIVELRAGRRPPTQAPSTLRIVPRVLEPTNAERPSGYSGTVFDRRTYEAAITKYLSFEAASAAIERPVFFHGVSDEIVSAIRECRWDDVLGYEDPSANDEDEKDRADDRLVLRSGTVTRDLVEDGELAAAARNTFQLLRRAYLRRRAAGLSR